MPTKEFDAASHIFYVTTYDGITFAVEGEPDGDSFSMTYANDTVTAIEGAKGDVQFNQRVASSAEITYTVQWGSASSKRFNQMFIDQQKGNFPKKVELKRINDNENVLIMTCARATIAKPADLTQGVEGQNREWLWRLEKAKYMETEAPA